MTDGVAAAAAPAWELVWADEFDGDRLDSARWAAELGSGFHDPVTGAWVPGWGNGELQTYTDDPAQLCLRDGCLVLRAERSAAAAGGFVSARIRSRTAERVLFEQTYGRFECRARASIGPGVWPAFWMLPSEAAYGGWAASGEIDVLEIVGSQPTQVLGSLHFGAGYPHRDHRTVVHDLPAGQSTQDFHVYAVEWDPGVIRWYVDEVCYAEQRSWWSASGRDASGGTAPQRPADLNPWPAPFDRPFHLLLNLAVGGGLPGAPTAATVFPAEFVVDYVRVYRRRGGVPPLAVRSDETLPTFAGDRPSGS